MKSLGPYIQISLIVLLSCSLTTNGIQPYSFDSYIDNDIYTAFYPTLDTVSWDSIGTNLDGNPVQNTIEITFSGTITTLAILQNLTRIEIYTVAYNDGDPINPERFYDEVLPVYGVDKECNSFGLDEISETLMQRSVEPFMEIKGNDTVFNLFYNGSDFLMDYYYDRETGVLLYLEEYFHGNSYYREYFLTSELPMKTTEEWLVPDVCSIKHETSSSSETGDTSDQSSSFKTPRVSEANPLSVPSVFTMVIFFLPLINWRKKY